MTYLVYFLSGVAGLIYQLVWSRILNDLFGVTAYAITVVVATFLAGLALGAVVIGRMTDRAARPLRVYGLLEIGIALFAVVGIWAVGALEPLHIAAANRMSADSPGLIAVRIALASLAILPPTMLMGGTLPAIARSLVPDLERLGRGLGKLYALNTLGGVVGCLAAGFFLIRSVGLHATLAVAVAINLTAGGVALLLDRGNRVAPGPPAPGRPGTRVDHGAVAVLVVVALSGFATMGFEVFWTRMLMLVVGTASYAFTTMLTCFLVGLALGSFLVRHLADRLGDPRRLFGWIQLGIAAAALASLPLLGSGLAQDWIRGKGVSWLGLIVSRFGVSACVMLVPTTLIGMTFPLAGKMWTRSMDRLGGQLGQVFGANTLGNVLGVTAGGFLILPAFGLQRGVAVLCTLNLVCAAWGLLGSSAAGRSRNAILPLICLVACVWLVVAWRPPPLPAWGEAAGSRVRYYREGVAATVKVIEDPGDPRLLWMAVDGIRIGQSVGGVDAKQQALAHFPFLLMAERPPRHLLSIGLGSGVMIGEAARHAQVETLDCVEVSAAVIEGARVFAESNAGVLDDPRAHVMLDDGVNYLRRATKRYDAILSDAKSRSTHAGNGVFFSSEYYRLCRDRLEQGGLFIQWVPTDVPPAELEIILRTLKGAFPYSYVWMAPPNSCFLVGTGEPLRLDPAHIERVLRDPATRNLRRYGWTTADDVLTLFSADREALAGWLGAGGRLNSIEHPILEFYSPRAFTVPPHVRRAENLENLLRARESVSLERFPARDLSPDFKRRFDAVSRWIAGLAQLERGDPERVEEAVALLDQALGELPGHGPMRYTLPQVYRRAMQSRPDSPTILTAAGRLRLFEGDLAGAELQLEAVVAKTPGHAPAHAALGMMYGSQGRFDRAIEHLEASLALEPDAAAVRSHLGVTLQLAGRPEAALEHLERALESDPGDLATMHALAQVLLSHPDAGVRDPRRAVVLAEHAAGATGFGNPAVLETLARAYAAAGLADRAAATAARARRLGSSGPATGDPP